MLCAILLTAILFVAFFSKSTSPLYGYRFIDSDIFRYMGYAMLHGKIPYTDLFDHKGLLLYWINALGYLIHSEYGIFTLQILAFAATLYVWHRMLGKECQEWRKWLILFASLLGLGAYYEDGNLAEEWSLLFISLPIMLWLEATKNKGEFSRFSSITIGLCCGALFLLRLNNMIPVLTILIYCLFEALWNKKYQYAINATTWIVLGFLVLPLAACLFMFLLNGIDGINDMFYAMIGFNMDYATDTGLGFLAFLENSILIIAPLISIALLLLFIKSDWRKSIPLLLAFIFTIITTGGNGYPHYYMLFIPLMVACFSVIPRNRMKATTYSSIIGIALIYLFILRGSNLTYYPMFYNDNYHDSFCEVIKPIPDSKKNGIWNMGGSPLLRDFIKSGITQQNRMFLNFQLGLSEKLYEEECNKIQKIKPEYVIYAVYTDQFDNEVMKYTIKNNYRESDSDYQFVLDNYQLISSVKREDGSILYCYRLHSKGTNN